MTGIDVYKQVVSLLGVETNTTINCNDKALLSNTLSTANRVIKDLGGTEIENLNEEISLNSAAEEALPYGVAMFLLLNRGDRERYNVFTDIYAKKRARAKSVITRIKNGHDF